MIIGSIVFGVYIYFSIGADQIFVLVRSLDFSSFLFYFSLSFGVMLLVMVFWAASWLALLRVLYVNLSLRKIFLYYMAGDFIDRIIPSPGVVGDVTRAFFVRGEIRGETEITYEAVVAAGITNRLVAYGTVVGGLSVGIIFLFLTGTVPAFASGLLLVVWLWVLALFVVLLLACLKENFVKRFVSGLIRLLRIFRRRMNTEKLSSRVFRSLSRFHDGFDFFGANPRFLIGSAAFNVVSFVLNFVVYVLVFYSVGLTQLPLDFFIVVFILAGAIQDGTAAFSVGGLEIFLTHLFIAYGIPAATSGVLAVILRTATFYFPLALGYVCLQVIGVKNFLNYKAGEQGEED